MQAIDGNKTNFALKYFLSEAHQEEDKILVDSKFSKTIFVDVV